MSTSGFPWDRALRRHAAREQAERERQELADQAKGGLPKPSASTIPVAPVCPVAAEPITGLKKHNWVTPVFKKVYPLGITPIYEDGEWWEQG